MRSVECPDAVAGASPRAEEVQVSDPRPAADSGQAVPLVSAQALAADSGQVLVFAPLDQPRKLVDFQHLLPRIVPLHPARLYPDGTSLSALTAHSDSGAFIIGHSFSITASDASRHSSRRSSSKAGYFLGRRSFLLSPATMAITGLRRHHRNLLS